MTSYDRSLYQDRPRLIRHSLWVTLFALAALALGVYRLDRLIAVFFARPELAQVYYWSREITNIGDSVHYFVISLAGIIFAKLLWPRLSFLRARVSAGLAQRIGAWSLFLLKALLLCGVVLHIFKFSIGRQRPHVAVDFYNLNFSPFNFHHHWQSLPSGHSQVLFTVATVAALIWPRGRWCFFVAALLFSFTRMTIHQHFFSDIMGGALVGYLVTVWMYHLWPPRKEGAA